MNCTHSTACRCDNCQLSVTNLSVTAPLPQAKITRYPDPLRGKRDEQAVIVAQLFCATCFCDLSNAPGLVDLKTGHAFCSADHWRKFFQKKGQTRV